MNVNLTNIINSNYTGNLTQGEKELLIKGSLSPKEAGISMLMSMSEGEQFTGEITNITGNQITLSMGDKINITATLADALSYNIGETATFSITSNDGDRIVLKSENPKPDLLNDQGIRSALQNANLAVNETTVNLVHNLMQHNMPIDADTLNHYVKTLSDIPQATPLDVVLLGKMDIPITADNVAALHDYYNFSEGITGKVDSLIDSVIEAATAEIAPSEDNPEIVNELPVKDNPQTIQEKITPEKLQVEDKNIPVKDVDIAKTTDRQPQAELSDKSTNISKTVKDFVTAMKPDFDFSKIDESTAKDPAKLKELIKDVARETFFLKPEEVTKENLNKLYEKILTTTKRVAEKMGDNPQAAQIIDNSNTIAKDVHFLNDVNHFMSFVQVPLKMAGQNAHGDLYVYNRGRGKNIQTDDLKALLHLDMDNLGPMDIFVTLHKNNVSTNFKVADDETLSYIEAHLDELNKRLTKLGYNVNLTAAVNDGNYSFKKSVLDVEIPSVDVKRFSFDVRA